MACGKKNLARLGAYLILIDETGFLMAPVLRRTWGRTGDTPEIRVQARSYTKVSGIGALVVSPERRRLNLFVGLHPDKNIRIKQVVRFIRHLRRHVHGRAVVLLDGAGIHTSRTTKRAIRRIGWIPEYFPPYAPKLNPVEQVWTYLKYGRLANFVPDDITHIRDAVRREARRARTKQNLMRGFIRASELPFDV